MANLSSNLTITKGSQDLPQLLRTHLEQAQQLIYAKYHYALSFLCIDKESTEYGACSFTLNNQNIIFRVAKITPTKVGQFVTLWQRIPNQPIKPYTEHDDFDYIIISTQDGANFGQFIFPKAILIKHGIITSFKLTGKLAMRVYPAWVKDLNKQAQKTQAWQLNYFFDANNADKIGVKIFCNY